ncbi:hypothetical protein GCM10027348_42700 [Hymenobacter tenuis]
MEAQVHATGMRPADRTLLARAQALRDSTHAVTGYLNSLGERLTQHTRNRDLLAQLATRDAVSEFMQAPGGPADSLRLYLSRFESLLQRTALPAGPGSVPDAPDLKQFDFGSTSFAGALAALARYETAVLLREEAALSQLSARLTPRRFRSALHPMVSAQTSSVAPGDTYRAQVYLMQVRYAPGGLTMTVNGKTVPVGADGIGKVVLPVPPLGAASRQQAFWEGSITVRVSPRDSTFRLRVPYTVVK